MKYIFDFDDVLFHTSRDLKERVYDIYQKHGVSQERVEEYIERTRKDGFSLKNLLRHFYLKDDLYNEIMKENKSFVNEDVLKIIRKINPDDCYILTMGDEEFQKDKIHTAGIEDLFSEIIVVLNSKKETIEKICEQFKNESVVFIDDKESHFRNLDFKKHPNLKTILYTGQDLNYLLP